MGRRMIRAERYRWSASGWLITRKRCGASKLASGAGLKEQKGGVMKRREFIRHAAGGMGAAAWLGSGGLAAKSSFLASLGMTNGAKSAEARLAALPALPRKFAANETVTIGKTGIQTSLLAMGTGTVGSGHHSHQTALGVKGLSELLLNGYEHGLRFLTQQIRTAAIRTWRRR